MTAVNSGTVIFLKTTYKKYPGAMFALVISEHTSDIEVKGDAGVIFNNLVQILEKWQEDDPLGFETIRAVFEEAFDFVGRDFDKEEEIYETKNSAA